MTGEVAQEPSCMGGTTWNGDEGILLLVEAAFGLVVVDYRPCLKGSLRRTWAAAWMAKWRYAWYTNMTKVYITSCLFGVLDALEVRLPKAQRILTYLWCRRWCSLPCEAKDCMLPAKVWLHRTSMSPVRCRELLWLHVTVGVTSTPGQASPSRIPCSFRTLPAYSI